MEVVFLNFATSIFFGKPTTHFSSVDRNGFKNGRKMKKIYYFMMLALYVLGTINGIAYSCYIKEFPTAIGVAVLAYMAWPTAMNYWKNLNA